MSSSENVLSYEYTVYLTAQYLQGQGWELISAEELGEEIWRALKEKNLAGQAAISAVQNQAWQRYATILHDTCLKPSHPLYQQAWQEISHWMQRQASRLVSTPQEQEEMVQESLNKLQTLLQKSPLKAPRAFFAYTLQLLQSGRVDLYRHRAALKRGGDTDLSLEVLNEEDETWHEIIKGEEHTENTVADLEIRQQLQDFFHQHLPSELQYQVAVAHFLDGLEPADIAGLMGKPPHEIRLVKARAVQNLKGLSEMNRQALLTILGKLEIHHEL